MRITIFIGEVCRTDRELAPVVPALLLECIELAVNRLPGGTVSQLEHWQGHHISRIGEHNGRERDAGVEHGGGFHLHVLQACLVAVDGLLGRRSQLERVVGRSSAPWLRVLLCALKEELEVKLDDVLNLALRATQHQMHHKRITGEHLPPSRIKTNQPGRDAYQCQR